MVIDPGVRNQEMRGDESLIALSWIFPSSERQRILAFAGGMTLPGDQAPPTMLFVRLLATLIAKGFWRSWKKPLLIATILGRIPIVHYEICPGPSMTIGFHELVLSSSSGDSCYTGLYNAEGLIS